MLPADRLSIHLLVEGVAGCLQGQDRTAVAALFDIKGDPRAFGKTSRPVADRHQFEATVVLDVFNLRTERIEMRDDGPGGEPLFAASDSANGAAPGQFRLHAEALQFL